MDYSRSSSAVQSIAKPPVATADRILLATGEEAARVGPERLRMGAVAARAGISRASLYRVFTSKDELIRAWTVHEFDAIFAAADAAAAEASGEGPEAQFAAGFAVAIRALRAHLIFRSLVVANNTQLIRSTLESASGLGHARSLLAERLGALGPADQLARGNAELAIDCELVVRLAVSLTVAPEGAIRVDSDADARAFARRHLAGLALGA